MSEGHSEKSPEEAELTPREPEPGRPPGAAAARPRGASRAAMPWLLTLLVLILAGIGLSPFWAPPLEPLLPWSENPAVSPEEYAALGARVAALEQRPVQPTIDADAIKQQLTGLAARVDRLQSGVDARLAEIEKRPAPPSIDLEAIKSVNGALAQRIDALEAAIKADRQQSAAVTADRAALQQLERRVEGIEAQSSSRAESEAAELQKIQQELSRTANTVADLAQRLPGLERQVQSQGDSERKEAMQTLMLLQIREAVEQARPFQAEYSAFKALDDDPRLASAAEPLAEAARNGVASHAVLSKRLTELAEQIANAKEPPPASDWGAQALARIRGLVTIRRINGAAQTGPEAAVSAAQTALARGDLAGAVAALETLTGASADAARPWLQMARERLSVEQALDQVQQLLTARIGSDRPAPGTAPPPPASAKSPS
jgi:hypothetical protein